MNNSSKRIVINTSPWIALSICSQTSLLNTMYEEVYMPEAVRDEIRTGGQKGIGVKKLNASSWMKIDYYFEMAKEIKKVNSE